MQNEKEKFKNNFIDRLVKFSISILLFADKFKKESLLWGVSGQLIRSSTSIGANVVEAKSSHSKKDYIKFFEIALKSANETKYWLILFKEGKFADNTEVEKLLNEVEEISKILGSSVLTLKGKK